MVIKKQNCIASFLQKHQFLFFGRQYMILRLPLVMGGSVVKKDFIGVSPPAETVNLSIGNNAMETYTQISFLWLVVIIRNLVIG